MAKREYSFYPGCSSQKGASSSNYLISARTMCEELDILSPSLSRRSRRR
jgi:heterodisulfide reductase subunit B2